MNLIRSLIYSKLADAFPAFFFDPESLPPTAGISGKRILIACSHFWPSIGGVESRIEQFASELAAAGHHPFIITPDRPDRTAAVRGGVPILGIPAGKRVRGLYLWPYAVRAALLSGKFDVCIPIQDPRGDILWSVENLPAGKRPHTRLIIQPIITDEGYAQWGESRLFRHRLGRLFKSADAVVAMTRTGPDVRFMLESGLSPLFIPNATGRPAASRGFRKRHGIAEESFLVLHVANLWWYKNHAGLIDALAGMPDSWKLVLIGNPTSEPGCAEAVKSKLLQHPRVLLLTGLGREDVSDAMEEADVFVLSSFGEGSPNTLLEAMAHRLPWVATPNCGAAVNNAGGIISSLNEFMDYLALLQEHSALLRRLGGLGYRHWESCCSWPQVLEGWLDVIETGSLRRNFVMPPWIAAEMGLLRSQAAVAVAARHGRRHPDLPEAGLLPSLPCGEPDAGALRKEGERSPREASLVNIGITTFNRLEFTRQAIEALLSVPAGCRFRLTVVDNASSDGTREYLLGLKAKGSIDNLVLLDCNQGVARASNLAWSLEPRASHYLKLDNDIVIRKAGWLGDMVEVAEALPEAGVVAYNFEPKSYHLLRLHGVSVRPKMSENLGGACILVPKRTHDQLGYWCEDYGLYGEEDADYGTRVRQAGLFNIYMEDEEVGFHLPAGRAARIGYRCRARDGVEEKMHREYRAWKDSMRKSHAEIFRNNVEKYCNSGQPLWMPSSFVQEMLSEDENDT
jgi:glycosyltransferase involved in cell wall biosynthesis